MGQLLERGAAQLFFGIAEHPAEHPVRGNPLAAQAQQGQSGAGGIEGQTIVLFGGGRQLSIGFISALCGSYLCCNG